MNLVFDNVIYSKEKQGGISNYWYEMTKAYAESKEAYFFEEEISAENIFRKKLKLRNLIPHHRLPSVLGRLLPIHYKSKTDRLLYHSSFYRQLVTDAEVCEITTIHDMTHSKLNPNGTVNRTFHNYLKYGTVRRSQGIICISNNTFNDLNRYCKPKKNQKTTVIYNGVSNDYKLLKSEDQCGSDLLSKLNVKDKFLLFVGHRYHYKNFDFAIKLLEELPEYKLMVVGNLLSEDETAAIDEKLLDRIVVANGISNSDLNILYNYAAALLYPSLYEGFGIPVIEAMKAGCPVLALKTSSIPEVAGGAALLFDEPKVPPFQTAVRRLENRDFRTEIVNAGLENSKKFDWTKCFKETEEFYEEVYRSSPF